MQLQQRILVSARSNSTSEKFVSCRDRGEASAFLDALAELPRFADSLLLRGVEYALRNEIYDAGDLLYRWTRSDAELGETVYTLEPDEKLVHTQYNYPVFAFDCASGPAGYEERTQALLRVLEM